MSTTLISSSKLTPVGYPIGFNMKENLVIIRELIRIFKDHKGPEDKQINIFCMGSSGAIVATIFTMELTDNCKIQHVKKEGESSHWTLLDIFKDNALNIIVDDIIDSGSTVNTIYEKISSRYSICNIDYICVTGGVAQDKLKFKPKYLICRGERGY